LDFLASFLVLLVFSLAYRLQVEVYVRISSICCSEIGDAEAIVYVEPNDAHAGTLPGCGLHLPDAGDRDPDRRHATFSDVSHITFATSTPSYPPRIKTQASMLA